MLLLTLISIFYGSSSLLTIQEKINLDEKWDIETIDFFLIEWRLVTHNKTFNTISIYSVLSTRDEICINDCMFKSPFKNTVIDINNELLLVWFKIITFVDVNDNNAFEPLPLMEPLQLPLMNK